MRLQFCGPAIEAEKESKGTSISVQAQAAGKSIWKFLSDRYLETPWVQCAVDGYGVLILVLFIDVILKFPIAFRAAYIAPIYYASRRGNALGQFITLVAVVFASAAVDLGAGFSNGEAKPLNLLFRFAVFGALTLVIDMIFRKLKKTNHLATHDTLTGAANRYAIDQFAQTEIRKANVTGAPLALAMIDCDEFKALNDRYGHAYGDQVLITLAKQVRKALPAGSLLGRNGGDEFVAILPNRTKLEAEAIMTNAYQRFQEATRTLGEPSRFSYGIAERGFDGQDLTSLFKAADRDMYKRKPSRVAVVNELEEGVLS